MSSVSIILIRNLSGTSSYLPDDKVVLRREDNNIRVEYTCTEGQKKTQQSLLLTHTGMSRYVENLGHLFLHDTVADEPFTHIQFNFPGFPCFLCSRESLQLLATQGALMEIADIVSESWFADLPEGCDCTDNDCDCE
jgi:hypothetical protein